MPNNMNFGVNIIPNDNTVTLGTASYPWKVYTSGQVGKLNVDYGDSLPVSGETGQIFYQILGNNSVHELPTGGATGQALVKSSANDWDVGWGAVGGIMTPIDTSSSGNASNSYYVTCSSSATENTDPAIFDTSVYIQGSVLFGAAWNDYAEYRQCNDKIQPGMCIVENGDGTLSKSSKRMQAGAEIVSDTFGFAIGKTDKCQTPIAVSGRVLAYTDKPREEFTIGAPVCAGENGTISEMTEEEARTYPWLIIGTVSSIPQEELWGAQQVSTKNRIWIRVR